MRKVSTRPLGASDFFIFQTVSIWNGIQTIDIHAFEMDGSLINMKQCLIFVWRKYELGWNVHLN
jgi:hypothetical protein